MARVSAIRNRLLRITNPGKETLHKAMLFAQLLERIDCPAAEQAEITRILGYLYPAHALDDTIKSISRRFLENAFAISSGAFCVGDIVALTPVFDQFQYQLRRILQICVDHHDSITLCTIQARSQGNLFSEIPAQVNDGYPVVLRLDALEHFHSFIGAAVI